MRVGNEKFILEELGEAFFGKSGAFRWEAINGIDDGCKVSTTLVTCILIFYFFVGFRLVEDVLGVFGGIGWAIGVDNLSVENGDTLVLPESDDAFVTTSVSFSKMSRRVDLLKGRGGGVVGILGFSEENGGFVDDGV